MADLTEFEKAALVAALAKQGLRSTRQREHIYAVLLAHRDHPTADMIYERARESMPSISMATVYNCLDTLTRCGLIRHIHLQNNVANFCSHKDEKDVHAHFVCRKTGKIHDIYLDEETIEMLQRVLPAGFQAEEMELSFRGNYEPQEIPERVDTSPLLSSSLK